MSQKRITRSLVILAVFLWSCWSVSAPMSISPNQKFLTVYRISIDTTPYFNKVGVGSWNPLVYTLSFSNSIGYITQLEAQPALTSLNQQYSSGRIQLSCKTVNFTTSSVLFQIYSNFSSSIQVLSYQFLIIANDYSNDPTQLQLYYCTVMFNANISNQVVGSANMNLPTPISQPQATSIFVTLFGLDISTTSSANIIDLGFSASFVNQTVVTFRYSSSSATPVFVSTIDLTFIAYNTAYYNRATFAGFTLASIQGSNSFQYNNPSNVYDYATLVGISSFHV